MPNNTVIIDDGLGNGGGGNQPLPPSWILVSNSQIVQWYEENGDPLFNLFQMKFNDMSRDYGSYPAYKMKYFINKSFMKLTGSTVDGTLQEIEVTPDSVSRSFTPEFIAGSSLPGGTHSIYITMRLYGEIGGGEFFLDEKTHSITLDYIKISNAIKLEKLVYNLVFVKSTGLLYGDKNIVISNNPTTEVCHVVFTQNNGYLSTDVASSATGFEIIGGVDVQNLENFPSPYSISGKLLDSVNTPILSFILNIEIVENDDIVVAPKTLDFTLIKSNADTRSATLQLINISDDVYTIALPTFLTSNIAGGNSSGDIIITTVNGSTILAGEYEDDIVISYDGKTLVIPAHLTVIDFITSEFQPNDHHFCLDGKKIKFYRQTPQGVFVKIVLDVLFKIEGQVRTAQIPLQGVYFNDRCDFDIGEVINNYFLKFRRNLMANCAMGNFLATLIYFPAELTMVAQELDENYNALTTTTLTDLKLYAGKKPKGFPFLTNHLVRSRIEGSNQIVSYITGLVDPEDIADNITIASALPDDTVASVLLCENNALVFWPSKKTFTKDGVDLDIYTRKSGNTVINIQWENQNFAPEYFSCSGDFSFSNDKVHTIDNSLRNANSKKFKTENTKKLLVDTGFILKAEIPVINELADALECIVQIDGLYYEGYVNNSKIIGENSTEELINYSLELVVKEYEN